ncbi:MAG TPA: DUF2232 domain-containing protein [Thermoanaerobaculia bacterium]|nr:DUF2232 domain-containing protein [Thermoanaerobaculia bacterium]
MIDTSLQQSEPVAVSQEPQGRQTRTIAGYSLLMALMILLGLPVFVPAVVLYCGIRFGSRSAAVTLFAAAVLSMVSVMMGGQAQDMRFAHSFAAGSVLALGVPAIAAIPLVRRGESFGRVLIVLLAAGALGMVITELLFRAVAGYSVYAVHAAQARESVKMLVGAYQANGMAAAAMRMERVGSYFSSTLVAGWMLTNLVTSFVLSLLMFGRLPAGRELAARVAPGATGTYQLRNLSLPDGVLFLFVLGGLAPLVTGLAHTIAANVLLLAVFLYIVQGFALLRFLLASLGVGFIGALLASLFIFLTGIGPLLLGLAGLFDPFFDFRHFKKRKDDSHESHSD